MRPKNPNPEQWAIRSFKFSPLDFENLETVRVRLGIRAKSEALRAALKIAAEETP